MAQNLDKVYEKLFLMKRESYGNKYKKLLRLTPNLVSFGDESAIHLSLFVDKNELLVPKLSKMITAEEDIQVIKTLVNNYKN